MRQLFKRVKAGVLGLGPAFRAGLCGTFGLALMLLICAAAPVYAAVRELPHAAMRKLTGGTFWVCDVPHAASECFFPEANWCGVYNCRKFEGGRYARCEDSPRPWWTCRLALGTCQTPGNIVCAYVRSYDNCSCTGEWHIELLGCAPAGACTC
jgi:hypothetical protein